MGDILTFFVDHLGALADPVVLVFGGLLAAAGFMGSSYLTKNRMADQEERMRLLEAQSTTVAPADEPPFEFVYEVIRAKEFYNAIAGSYDQRNSSELLATHRAVISCLTPALDDNPADILDLGGGTGQLIAHRFFDKPLVTWNYVDFSPMMAERFQDNFSQTALKCRIHVNDVSGYLDQAVGASVDFAVLSMLLSSLPRDPDWTSLYHVLRAGGKLVVADADPAYTAIHPYYAISVDEQRHALRPRSVSPAQVTHDAGIAGFRHISTDTVRKANLNYTFIIQFQKPQ